MCISIYLSIFIHAHTHRYEDYGFVWIQDLVERAIINVQSGRDIIAPAVATQQMPYPCYLYDLFFITCKHMLPLCLVISWVYPVATLVQNIVYEKEGRLKEVV